MRIKLVPARRSLAILALGLALAVPAVGARATGASAASPPIVGCGFHFGAISEQGAADTLYFSVALQPTNPAQRCTTSVKITTSVTHGAPATLYTTVDNNPMTSTANLSFVPGRFPPRWTVGWGQFHCADPAVPGSLTFASAGQSQAIAITPTTCAGMGHSSLESLPIPAAHNEVGIAPALGDHGYRTVNESGAVSHEGNATALLFASPLVCPAFGCLASGAVGIVTVPTGNGAWVVTGDGGVFSYGTAAFAGSLGGVHLNQPIVGMSATPTGRGYWLVASDGGVFAFGDARFHGSLGAMHLNAPIVGIAAAPDGRGYWLTASDGGVFAFGTARFAGSLGAVALNAPVISIAAGPHGGYWLVGTDGSVFAFGGAAFKGSLGALRLNDPVSAMAATSTGNGYWLLGADGGVFAFGDAHFYGAAPIFFP
jgi:hypothetical protein